MNILEITLIALVKIVVLLVVILLIAAYAVYFERKISAWIQNRIGPNRVGYRGLLQSFADVFKLLFKEDIVPTAANKPLHTLAPFIALFVAFSTYAPCTAREPRSPRGRACSSRARPPGNIGRQSLLP